MKMIGTPGTAEATDFSAQHAVGKNNIEMEFKCLNQASGLIAICV